jgi:hypothetical protein
MVAIKHPLLGTVVGDQFEGIDRFLGLRYASLRDRFAAPVLDLHARASGVDATKYG